MPEEERASCGQELAASAEVPAAVARLFAHVALNLRGHAAWVGGESQPACAECDALLRVALDYERIAAAAEQAARHMRTCAVLEPAAHDPATLDRSALRSWMQTKLALQRALADLLLAHAQVSESALADLG